MGAEVGQWNGKVKKELNEGWENDRDSDWVSEWMIHWVSDLVRLWTDEWVIEWVSNWLNAYMTDTIIYCLMVVAENMTGSWYNGTGIFIGKHFRSLI